jgi:hypothetical protein
MATSSNSSAVAFAQDKANQQRFLNELKELLRIPSVSTLPQHKGDVRRAAQFMVDELKRIGFEKVELIDTAGHPLVYAEWLKAASKPTVLCYGHLIHWMNGKPRLLSPPSAMATFTLEAQWTTRARCTCT